MPLIKCEIELDLSWFRNYYEIELDLSWLRNYIISEISRTAPVADNPAANPSTQPRAEITTTTIATF